MIKAVFFDIDGTLLSFTTRKIPESTLKALHILKEKGVNVDTSVLTVEKGFHEIMNILSQK